MKCLCRSLRTARNRKTFAPLTFLQTYVQYSAMPKYSKKAQNKVKKAMHEYKKGSLKMGKSGKKVKSRKQAIAIGLSEARHSGAKVPSRRKRSNKSK